MNKDGDTLGSIKARIYAPRLSTLPCTAGPLG